MKIRCDMLDTPLAWMVNPIFRRAASYFEISNRDMTLACLDDGDVHGQKLKPSGRAHRLNLSTTDG